MKKTLSLFLLITLLVFSLFSASAETVIEVDMDRDVPVPRSLKNNPVSEDVNPLTGLPATGEPYTPVLVVLNNDPTAFPHWGVGAASILFQVPNQGFADTKLMALYTDEFPELVGGTRSGRMTMLPMANAFNAAFACAGTPPLKNDSEVNVDSWLRDWGYKKQGKYYNLLGNHFQERAKNGEGGNALLAHMREIHEDLIKKGVTFEARPFLFSDKPVSTGPSAATITLKFYSTADHSGRSNGESNCVFRYEEGKGYTRESVTGVFSDRLTGEPLYFSNIIIMRVKSETVKSYNYLLRNMAGRGQADLFQCGHYNQGSWYRADAFDRLIFLNHQGNEFMFQPGKTFIVLTNADTLVTCE